VRCLAPLLLAAAAAAAPLDGLDAAVDQPDAAARRKAALALAQRDDVELDALLAALRGFAPRKAREGAGTRDEEVACDAGGRTLTLSVTVHVPEGLDPARPAPLLLALHGAGGDGRQEAARWRDVADALGMLVLAPTEGAGNEGYRFSVEERAEALAALRWARRHFNVDENRVHVTGVSRGGHLTWDLALRHPDLFASLAPMIGGPRLDPSHGQNNLRFAENVAHLPIRDLQGEEDDPRLLFNLRLLFARLQKAGATDARLLTFPGLGHDFDFGAVDWRAFFPAAQRDPRPARVVRLCADAREGRAFWAEITKTAGNIREDVVPKVRAAEWNALDDAGRRRFMEEEAEKRTARLEAEMVAPGEFVVKSEGVRAFRLLLDAEMFDPGAPVKVTWNGRVRTRTLKPSKAVALTDFVERFDRTFLPVTEFKVP